MKNLILPLVLLIFVIAGCTTTGETPEENTAIQPAEDTTETEVTPPDTSDEPDVKTTDPEESTEPEETPEPDEIETPEVDETETPEDDADTPEEDVEETPEVDADPMSVYQEYLNNETVKKVVDAFLKSVLEGNDTEYQKFIDWEKVAANTMKPLDVVKYYFDCKEMQNALSCFNVEINFYKNINYYNDKVGHRRYVGYGMWKCTPKTEIGEEFEWLVRLAFYTNVEQWKIVEISRLPEEVRGYYRQNFGIVNEETRHLDIYVYFFTPEQFVEFLKKEKEDKYYIPADNEYHHRKFVKSIAQDNDDDESTEPEDSDDVETPEYDVNEFMNKESVKKVVDAFMKAIEDNNDAEFQKYISWNKVAENAQKPKDLIIKYFNIKDIHEALSYFDVKIDFMGKYDYYSAKVGERENVGYGMWKCTPKGEIGEEFTWIIRLEFNVEKKQWQIVEMGAFSDDVIGLKRVNFGIDDNENNKILIYTYFFTPKQYYEFKKKEKEDPYYVPQSTDEYHHRELIKVIDQPIGDDDGGYSPEVDVPEKIENLNLSDEYIKKIDEIAKGNTDAYKKFSSADKKRDVVGTLINIIIDGAKDGFKTKLSSEAALEANKALQKIFEKDKGRDKTIHTFRISKLQSDEGQVVDDDTLYGVVDVLDLWLKLFEKEGWSAK